MDDTGCVRECLKDGGGGWGVGQWSVGLWQGEKGRLAPQKPRDGRSLQPWSKAKLRASGLSGGGVLWPGQAEGKSGKIGFDSLFQRRCRPRACPAPSPQSWPVLAVRAGWGLPEVPSPSAHQVVPTLSRSKQVRLRRGGLSEAPQASRELGSKGGRATGQEPPGVRRTGFSWLF